MGKPFQIDETTACQTMAKYIMAPTTPGAIYELPLRIYLVVFQNL